MGNRSSALLSISHVPDVLWSSISSIVHLHFYVSFLLVGYRVPHLHVNSFFFEVEMHVRRDKHVFMWRNTLIATCFFFFGKTFSHQGSMKSQEAVRSQWVCKKKKKK